MIRKMMARIYEGFTDALWQLGYLFGTIGRALVYTVLTFTVPLWALPYWLYYRRRRGR